MILSARWCHSLDSIEELIDFMLSPVRMMKNTHAVVLLLKISALYLCCWCLKCSVFSQEFENLSFWWIVTTGTTMGFQALWPPEPNGRRARSLPSLCKSLHAAQHLDSTLGQMYEPNFKRQSRYRRHTRMISPPDRTGSKHLAQTSLQSHVLCLKLALLGGDENVECIEKSRAATWLQVRRIAFLNV